MRLAGLKADEAVARAAASEAALAAVGAAKARLLPKLSGSVSGAWLANPPTGKTIEAGSIPIYLYNPTTGWAVIDPATGKPAVVSFPPVDLALIPDAKDTYFKGNVTFSQPLFAWGKIRAGIDLALLEAKIADIDSRGAALDAGRQANRVYFAALLARRSAAILEELVGLAEQIVGDRRSALDEGLATKEQLLSSQADLADLRSRLVEAREGERSSLEALAFYTGLDPDRVELVSDFRPGLPAIDEGGLKEATALSSTAFAEAGARLSEARRKLDLERGSAPFKPDLSLFASLDASGQDIPYSGGSWMDTWSWDLSLGVAAQVDLFDGGAAAARRKEAAAGVDAAEAAMQAAGKGARLEARRAVEAARKAEAALAAAEARGEWAAEALRAARASAADQLISRSELAGAAIREASAHLAALDARYSLEQAAADLDRIGLGAGR